MTIDAPTSLADINADDREAFIALLGDVFEHAPWVAEAAWPSRPFESVDALHAAMLAAVQGAPRAEQIAFLCGHPELAGREALAGTMTGHSTAEQSTAGLDALSAAELVELQNLNAAYRVRHGFPFIIAVRDHDKAQIFAALRTRVAASTDAEIAQALAQIARITRWRLRAMFGLA